MNEYEKAASYCKYMSDRPEVLEDVFVNWKVRFTQPAALNDPLDCNPLLTVPSASDEHSMYDVAGVSMPSENLWFHIQLVESHLNEYGVLSLTKNPVSSDMWSLYSNGHKGFLLEFAHDFPEHPAFRSPEGERREVKKVEYVDKFLIDLRDCLQEDGRLDIDKFRDLLFYRKAKRWAREKEFRMVRPLTDLGKKSGGIHVGIERDLYGKYLSILPHGVINSVTFGANMKRETKLWIIEKCKKTNIQFMQSVVYPLQTDDEGLSPKIYLEPLEEPKIRKQILDMHPQLLLMAGEHLLGHQETSVPSVKDLPYYQGYEHLVQMLYERRATHRNSG